MLGCVSVVLATSRAERAFGQRYQRTSELWTTQLAVRRAFLQLLMEEQAAAPAPGQPSAESTARPRLLLEPDLGAPADQFGVRPHRFEVTVARSPVPASPRIKFTRPFCPVPRIALRIHESLHRHRTLLTSLR
jgi:hypothetical protein